LSTRTSTNRDLVRYARSGVTTGMGRNQNEMVGLLPRTLAWRQQIRGGSQAWDWESRSRHAPCSGHTPIPSRASTRCGTGRKFMGIVTGHTERVDGAEQKRRCRSPRSSESTSKASRRVGDAKGRVHIRGRTRENQISSSRTASFIHLEDRSAFTLPQTAQVYADRGLKSADCWVNEGRHQARGGGRLGEFAPAPSAADAGLGRSSIPLRQQIVRAACGRALDQRRE